MRLLLLLTQKTMPDRNNNLDINTAMLYLTIS